VIEIDAGTGAPPLAAAATWVRARAWIAGWWLTGRAVVFAAAAAVHLVGPNGYTVQADKKHVLGVLASWDGRWYRIVASNGYLLVPGRQSDPAFFPLYPTLLRFGHGLGLGYSAAGILMANVAFVVALFAFHTLTSDLFGATLAHRATVYLAIFPFGYVFSMAYPESIVLAAMLLSCVAAMRGRWGLAAVFAGAASLARPEGLFVVLPLLALAWRQRTRLTPLRRGLAYGAILAAVGALAAYPLYLAAVLHDPNAWGRAERAWGRQFRPLGIVHAFTHVSAAFDGNAWIVRDIAAAALYAVLLAAAARAGAPRSWLLASAAIVVLPLFSGAFTSLGRFGLLAVAVFWGLASLGRRPGVDLAVRLVSLMLLAAATATIPLVFP
jgi:hypothetical protein